MNDRALSRRHFLASAAGTGSVLSSLTASAYARAAGANERVAVGIVGPGGRGRNLLKTFFDVQKQARAELVALCDLWSVSRERATALAKQATGQAPRQVQRIEELLAAKDVDAMIVATPDHAHAQHLGQCLQAHKHVYCEKPFANVLDEANAAIDLWRKSDKVVTLGTQRRSDPRHLAAQELVRTGVLGPIVQVDVVFSAYSPYRWRREADVQLLKEKDTDWKTFLMGRPGRAFDPRVYIEFRLFRGFSTGIIDQWMTHHIDAVHMLTGARFPKSVVAHGGTYAWKDYRENGDTVHVLLEYPEGFLCTYATSLVNPSGNGSRVMGRQGTLEYQNTWTLTGEGIKGSKLTEPRPILPKADLEGDMDHIHMRNWLECIHRGDRQTNCTPEHGYQHAIACIMADRALHTGRRQVFDEKSRTIREG